PRLALLQRLQYGVGEDLELGRLPEEVRLVVREVGDHPVQLLRPLGPEAEVVVVVLERPEAEAGQPALEPRAQRGALALVEEEPVALVDELAEEPELLLGQLHVMVRGTVANGAPTFAGPRPPPGAPAGRGPTPSGP